MYNFKAFGQMIKVHTHKTRIKKKKAQGDHTESISVDFMKNQRNIQDNKGRDGVNFSNE